MNLGILGAIGSIVLINLVLSGDNAIVIGMAARSLPRTQRRGAILWGTLGAVGLRVLFTALAFLLLSLPWLQLVGGLILLWVAFKLLAQPPSTREAVPSSGSLGEAIWLIITADAVMSLDNMLAVAAAAQGRFELVILGLALSIPLLMIGAGLIAQLLERLSWLNWLGGALIAWIAAQMILNDPFVEEQIAPLAGLGYWALLGGMTGLTLLISWLWGHRRLNSTSHAGR